MDFEINTDHSREPYTVMTLSGDIDVHSAPRLRQRLVEEINDGHRHVVLDMAQVSFVDSGGIGVLVGALKRLRSLDGDLALVGCDGHVLNVFEITGLASAFHVARTVQDVTGR